MKKTGKAGLGHLTKMEKTGRRVAADRPVLAAKIEAARRTMNPRRHCG